MDRIIQDFLTLTGVQLTQSQLETLRYEFAVYGYACVMDSEYRKEAMCYLATGATKNGL